MGLGELVPMEALVHGKWAESEREDNLYPTA